MDGILLVSKRTYSISKKKPIVEWRSSPLPLNNINVPKNFEVRCVNAALDGKSLENTFNELRLSWSNIQGIKNAAKNLVSELHGLTDIAWFSNELHLAIIINSHIDLPKIIKIDNIDELKMEFMHNAA